MKEGSEMGHSIDGDDMRTFIMKVRPIELRTANDFVAEHHRHHAPVVGHRFSLALYSDWTLCGVVIVGRPVSRSFPPLEVLEVTRLCTDGTRNACSMLYGAAARVGREMGYRRIQTYILESEHGASLKASGWKPDGTTKGAEWKYSEAQGVLPGMTNRRTDQPTCNKTRWARILDTTSDEGGER